MGGRLLPDGPEPLRELLVRLLQVARPLLLAYDGERAREFSETSVESSERCENSKPQEDTVLIREPPFLTVPAGARTRSPLARC